jgi:replicative superfamily II helicase
MQSECFDIFYKSNAHAVVSSPTGSGKTALFELAILRLLSEENYHQYKERDKVLIAGCLCRSYESTVSNIVN